MGFLLSCRVPCTPVQWVPMRRSRLREDVQVPQPGRHRADPDDFVERAPATGVRLWIARALLWFGRVVLVLWPVGYVAARINKSLWLERPVAAEPWIVDAMMTLSVIIAAGLPLLVLPFGSGATSRVEGSRLVLETVLGRRSVDRHTARIRTAYVPGRGRGAFFSLVSDNRKRWFIQVDSQFWAQLPQSWRGAVVGLAVLVGWFLGPFWLIWALLGWLPFREHPPI